MGSIIPLATHATGRATVSVYPDPATMGCAAAAALRELDRVGRCADADATGRMRSMAISGGSTPVHLYRALAAAAAGGDGIDWSRWWIFQVDERPVPPDHADSNFGLARRELIERCCVAAGHVHRMVGEAASAADEARRYEALLREHLATVGGVPRFDLILLGMGDDGHTASLFPGTAALDESTRLVVANEVPDKQTTRLTLTFPAINAAAAVWFLTTGASKAELLRDIVGGTSAAPGVPAARVRPRATPRWFVDEPAASLLR